MTRINRIGVTKEADGSIDIVIPAGATEEFKLAIKKAINCWPDMSVEFRDFADRLLDRSSFVGSCMKTEIYGHTPHGKWEIPAEDKFELASATKSIVEVITEEAPFAAPSFVPKD